MTTPEPSAESLTPVREQRLLAAALVLEAGPEREAFLASINEPDLRRRLEELLAASAAADSFFGTDPQVHGGLEAPDHPTHVLDSSKPPAEAPAQVIGRYKLLEKIGEGGFGEVWMAEQREPVKRRVALKIIKLGMDSRQVVARFEAERQALAMMDHPNIARIFDADVNGSGRPYFVMELVRGIRITDYCDQHQLTTKDRLDLFVKVCHAIQHAHQKGIIHRDIKPSNILVTLHDGVPVPKVIDFGIAKATQQELTDLTVFTQFQQFIGTPAYISPEQAEMSGLDIDTRADIYSLGVLLYELLVGQTPFDAKEMMQGGLDALVRIIREREPVRPSTRLSTLPGDARTTAGKRRHTDVSKLVHQLRGDLDWIVMKCLEKDRTRRYDTANGLATDIRRHLSNEPVVARPPSRLYAFRKLVRRHKLIFVMISVVILSLLAGVIGVSIEYWESERHRRVAEAAQLRARENFEQARAAVGDLLAVSDEDLYDKPGMQLLRVKLMRAALDRYERFLKQPAPDPDLRAELGRLYLRYGFNAKATGADYKSVVVPAYDSALNIQQQLVSEHPGNRTYRADLGWTIVCSKLWYDDTSGVSVYQPQAISIFEGLVLESPADPFARLGLAWALGLDVAGVLPDDPDKTAKSERRLALLEQLVMEYPLSAEFRRDLANQLAWYPRAGEKPSDYAAELARVFRANGLRAAVAAGLEQNEPAVLLPSYPINSEAKVLRPSLLWARIDLAYGWQRQSELLAKLQRWPEAISLADRSATMHRDLLEQNPSVKVLATMLESAFKNLADVTELSGDEAGAQTHRREAQEFWRAHPSLNPNGK